MTNPVLGTVVARVHLYPPSHCAGAEMMLHELLKALIAKGYRCQVWLSRRSRETKPYSLDGVEVYPCNSGTWLQAATEADVLVTHLDNTAPVVSAAIAYRKPLIQILHNTHPPTKTWATCKAELLVANSEWLADDFGRPDNMITVRPPVWLDDYQGPNLGRKITLINLNQGKGGLLFAQLAALNPDWEFLGVAGAYGEQLVPDLPNVTIEAHGADMRQVYASTKVLLMPSVYESWGRTGIEAMCSGIPVIAHPTPGLTESLGYAGLFEDRNDPYAWSALIEDLLEDPAFYASQAEFARKRAAELDPTDDLDRWVEAVESLTSEN